MHVTYAVAPIGPKTYELLMSFWRKQCNATEQVDWGRVEDLTCCCFMAYAESCSSIRASSTLMLSLSLTDTRPGVLPLP